MALTKIALKPGINRDDTPLSAEGGYTDADKVRFVRGQPQTIGGWDLLTSSTFSGIARGAHAWIDAAGRKHLAWGTATSLYVLSSSTLRDITPVFDRGGLTDPFTTTSGSAVVIVAHTGHALATGQIATFSNQTAAVGGLTLSGAYTVTVTDADHYTVTAGSNASSSATGGANVDYSYSMTTGLVDGIGESGGYGSGAYGSGGYGGTVTSSATQPRVWSLDSFGENLLAVPRGGALYEFQPSIDYPELVTNGDFASATGWTAGTGWVIGLGVATATAGSASDLSRPVTMTAGAVYRVQFTVTRTAGYLSFKTNGGALSGNASWLIGVSGTYDRLFRATPGSTSIVFSKDGAFAGTIDNVSVSLASTAYRVQEAPSNNDAMFVDPNGIVVLIGTNLYLDVYNQLAIRWSDIQDVTAWVPTPSNLSGDTLLSVGGRAMGGIVSRAQNLLWTDTALYTMTFTGDASDPFVFRLAGTGCGLIGPLARAEYNGAAFWMSKDNFFSFQGSVPQPIPSGLRRDLFDNLADGQREKIVAGINSAFSEVWWFYPDSRDGSECSRYVILQFEEGHWSCGQLNRTSWVRSGAFENPIALSADGHVYLHERGQTAAGSALASFVEASYFDVQDGENLMFVRRIVPDFEGQAGPVTFDIYYKRFPNAAEVFKGTYTAATNTEKIDLRVTARQIKFRLAGNAAPSFYRLGALKFDALPTGQTR